MTTKTATKNFNGKLGSMILFRPRDFSGEMNMSRFNVELWCVEGESKAMQCSHAADSGGKM